MLTFLMHEAVPKALANELQDNTDLQSSIDSSCAAHSLLCGFNSGSVLLCIHLLLANAVCNMVTGHRLCRAAG